MTNDANCFICKQRDIKSVMQRVKSRGYAHQSCLDMAISYLQINLLDVAWSDIQQYILYNHHRIDNK